MSTPSVMDVCTDMLGFPRMSRAQLKTLTLDVRPNDPRMSAGYRAGDNFLFGQLFIPEETFSELRRSGPTPKVESRPQETSGELCVCFPRKKPQFFKKNRYLGFKRHWLRSLGLLAQTIH